RQTSLCRESPGQGRSRRALRPDAGTARRTARSAFTHRRWRESRRLGGRWLNAHCRSFRADVTTSVVTTLTMTDWRYTPADTGIAHENSLYSIPSSDLGPFGPHIGQLGSLRMGISRNVMGSTSNV